MNTAVEKVKIIINDKGLKQKAVAKKAGFSERSFSDLMNGRKTFKVEYVLPLCEAIGISPNDLFGIERK